MTDRPIIFSAPMVRTLLDGRKTMTRRLAFKPVRGNNSAQPSPWQKVKAGDRLWVRENFKEVAEGRLRITQADYPQCVPAHYQNIPSLADIRNWKPSIHMPRWASRLTLGVTAVKIERLQSITPADAIAEGIPPSANSQTIDCDTPNPVHGFRDLWISLHGAGSWEANPEVVAITFTVTRGNIDALRARGARREE